MTEQFYNKISKPFKANKRTVKLVKTTNKLLTALVYISYPVLLLYLSLFNTEKLIKSIFVPAVMLVIVSALRKLINRPRPYAVLKIEPIIEKEKCGESMPSRHIFSVFMIAMTFLYACPVLFLPFVLIGIILGLVRVISGVHYPSDVFVGAAIGILSGIAGFFII